MSRRFVETSLSPNHFALDVLRPSAYGASSLARIAFRILVSRSVPMPNSLDKPAKHTLWPNSCISLTCRCFVLDGAASVALWRRVRMLKTWELVRQVPSSETAGETESWLETENVKAILLNNVAVRSASTLCMVRKVLRSCRTSLNTAGWRNGMKQFLFTIPLPLLKHLQHEFATQRRLRVRSLYTEASSNADIFRLQEGRVFDTTLVSSGAGSGWGATVSSSDSSVTFWSIRQLGADKKTKWFELSCKSTSCIKQSQKI